MLTSKESKLIFFQEVLRPMNVLCTVGVSTDKQYPPVGSTWFMQIDKRTIP